MTCCCLSLQKKDELSYPLRVDEDHAGLQYLKRAKDVFVIWKASGTAGFINETFTTCIQTMNALPELLKHEYYPENSCRIPLKGGVNGPPSKRR